MTLTLLNSHGHCPKHFVKVTLNEQGPRGETGKTDPVTDDPHSVPLGGSSKNLAAEQSGSPHSGTPRTASRTRW
jgi:hypothetical protein